MAVNCNNFVFATVQLVSPLTVAL